MTFIGKSAVANRGDRFTWAQGSSPVLAPLGTGEFLELRGYTTDVGHSCGLEIALWAIDGASGAPAPQGAALGVPFADVVAGQTNAVNVLAVAPIDAARTLIYVHYGQNPVANAANFRLAAFVVERTAGGLEIGARTDVLVPTADGSQFGYGTPNGTAELVGDNRVLLTGVTKDAVSNSVLLARVVTVSGRTLTLDGGWASILTKADGTHGFGRVYDAAVATLGGGIAVVVLKYPAALRAVVVDASAAPALAADRALTADAPPMRWRQVRAVPLGASVRVTTYYDGMDFIEAPGIFTWTVTASAASGAVRHNEMYDKGISSSAGDDSYATPAAATAYWLDNSFDKVIRLAEISDAFVSSSGPSDLTTAFAQVSPLVVLSSGWVVVLGLSGTPEVPAALQAFSFGTVDLLAPNLRVTSHAARARFT